MNQVFIEKRILSDEVTLSWDLAHHLYTRELKGKVIIITPWPTVLLASLRKQWMKLIRRLELEIASTLDRDLRANLQDKREYMQSLKFFAKSENIPPQIDVLLTNSLAGHTLPIVCHTAYLIYPLSPAEEAVLKKCIIEHGLIVKYA